VDAVDLHVRGEIPARLSGSLIVATGRRDKRRGWFSRWHDSPADLVRIDLSPGRPGRARARVLEINPAGVDLGPGFSPSDFDCAEYRRSPRDGYATQPNHALNASVSGDRVWATNLLFGAPLEVDLRAWKATRILRYVTPCPEAPRLTATSHFAWSLDGRYAYFHQSLLGATPNDGRVTARELRLVRLDSRTGTEKVWELQPPADDNDPGGANFHSVFYFEESGKAHVGLLRTGAVLEGLTPHTDPVDHTVQPMTPSTIWIVQVDDARSSLEALLLPGIRALDGLALSHLDVDNASGNGFTLFANFKEADVAEETHGDNIYGEPAAAVSEHYSGMTVQPLNVGQVIRVHRSNGCTTVTSFRRAYDAGHTSHGHTWLPINISLDQSRTHLFCTFAGFRPRLLSRHIAASYPGRAIHPEAISYVPPLLIRLDAQTLQPDYSGSRDYLSYAEPVAMCVAGATGDGFVCTFSPELGLRIYRAADLSAMVAHVSSHPLWQCGETHFRPEPAHMSFVEQ
jgi:hypothetical protein